MLHPGDFIVNQAWIAFRLNEIPIPTKTDGDFNIVTLMDAASCFMLSSEFVSVEAPEPSQRQAERLLEVGESHKNELPETLYIPRTEPADILSAAARRRDIDVVRVAESALLPILGEARKTFREYMARSGIE